MKNESNKKSINEELRELLYIEMVAQLFENLQVLNNKLDNRGEIHILIKKPASQ